MFDHAHSISANDFVNGLATVEFFVLTGSAGSPGKSNCSSEIIVALTRLPPFESKKNDRLHEWQTLLTRLIGVPAITPLTGVVALRLKDYITFTLRINAFHLKKLPVFGRRRVGSPGVRSFQLSEPLS
jgi:hypothetical protein